LPSLPILTIYIHVARVAEKSSFSIVAIHGHMARRPEKSRFPEGMQLCELGVGLE